MGEVFYQLDPIVDKYEAFEKIIKSCSIYDSLDRESFLKKVVDREHIQTTGMGHGVAIAHGKVEGIGKPLVALGFSKAGIIYDDIFPEPVHLLFVIASDVEQQNEYIKAVSSILSWVHNADFRCNLSCSVEYKECIDFLTMLKTRNFHPLQIQRV